MKQGTIVIVEKCPPLHGSKEKDRRAIVLFDYGDKGGILVACSGTPADPKKWHRLPDKTTQPQCKSGCVVPTWAIHEWVLFASADRMQELGECQSGYISGKLLTQIREAAADFLDKAMPI